MNRPVKFRAWDTTMKKMREVVAMDFGVPGVVAVHLGGGEKVYHPFFELMQFTGLHDKNGKEIYEGDIVTRSVGKGASNRLITFIVSWSRLFAGFYLRSVNRGDGGQRVLRNDPRLMEIVGNIHENPELLK